MRPSPVHIRVDETPQQWPDAGPQERRRGEEREGVVHLVRGEQVAHGAARDAEEGAARQALEEARDDDGADVAGDGAGHDPHGEGGEGGEVDGAAAVELAERAPHGPQGDAQHEGRQAQRREQAPAAELGVHLRVRARVDGARARHAEAPRRREPRDEPLARRRHAARVPGVVVAPLKAHLERVLVLLGRRLPRTCCCCCCRRILLGV